MSENSQNLLPCPFCGGEPELKHLGRHYGASCADWKCQGMQGALMHLDGRTHDEFLGGC
ncbi:Lar family restriction alleviation protein [Paraburkholderia sp. XV]|uniref:Lar family restriction alleviation protein n=1 Tax=Paraburkholderia sp. XV TaxID=2831520 RepID=UPI001CD4BC26|nr:Lar family restriction alleviation protein [Paraburkholderia sp. XV]